MPRSLLTATFIVFAAVSDSLLASEPSRIPADAPTGAELMAKVREDLQWLAEVESLQIEAVAVDRKSPEELEKTLQQLRRMYPAQKEFTSREFTELLPEVKIPIHVAYDRNRIRLAYEHLNPEGNQLYRFVDFRDGDRTVGHMISSGFTPYENYEVKNSSEPFTPDIFSYFHWTQQPISFDWEVSPRAGEPQYAEFGEPENYILVDREDFHGVDCYVLLRVDGFNDRDRFYIGVKDHRWYGGKSGIISLTHYPDLSKAFRSTVEKFLGRKLDDSTSEQDWQLIRHELADLKGERRTQWAKLNYDNFAKHLTPVFEFWCGPYHDLGSGRSYPREETLLTYSVRDPQPPFIGTTRVLKIDKVIIDEPLNDQLFQEKPNVGASVWDQTHTPPLFYEFKEQFTEEEWKEILEQGEQRVRKQQRQSRKGLGKYGKPVRELPQTAWLNSDPLTWEQLKGKIVLLSFWSVNHPESLKEIESLKSPWPQENDLFESARKSGLKSPIVVIGVHQAGTPLPSVRKAAEELKLQSPIVIDEELDNTPGLFADACGVTRFPTTVAFDESGNLLAIGSYKDVRKFAQEYAQQKAE